MNDDLRIMKLPDNIAEFNEVRRKQIKIRRALYQRLLTEDEFSVRDVTILLRRCSDTLNKWENAGIVPVTPRDENGYRRFSKRDLLNLLNDLMDRDWTHGCDLDFEELGKIRDMLTTELSITERRREVDD